MAAPAALLAATLPPSTKRDPAPASKPAAHAPKAAAAQQAASGQQAEAEGGLSTTVFVRGLPLDTSQEVLRAALRAHGPVKSCRCVPPGQAAVRRRR